MLQIFSKICMSYCQSCSSKIGLSSLKQQGPTFFDNGEMVGLKHHFLVGVLPFCKKIFVACLWTVNWFATVTLMCFCLFHILFSVFSVYEEGLYRSRSRHDDLLLFNFSWIGLVARFGAICCFVEKWFLITVLGAYCELIGSFSVSFPVRIIGI